MNEQGRELGLGPLDLKLGDGPPPPPEGSQQDCQTGSPLHFPCLVVDKKGGVLYLGTLPLSPPPTSPALQSLTRRQRLRAAPVPPPPPAPPASPRQQRVLAHITTPLCVWRWILCLVDISNGMWLLAGQPFRCFLWGAESHSFSGLESGLNLRVCVTSFSGRLDCIRSRIDHWNFR